MSNLGPLSDRPALFSHEGQVDAVCICGGSDIHRSRYRRVDFSDPFGGGRVFTVSEIALVFHCSAWRDESGTGGGELFNELPLGTKRISVGVVVEVFCPAHGYSLLYPRVAVSINQPAFLIQPPDLYINGNYSELIYGDQPANSNDGLISYGSPNTGGHGGSDRLGVGNRRGWMAWEGDYTVPLSETTMDFKADRKLMHLNVYDDSRSLNSLNLSQTIPLDFPDAIIPVPSIPADPRTWGVRIKAHDQIEPTDVVRSLVVSHGDYRLVSNTRAVKASVFQPHPDYASPTKAFAHSLLKADGSVVEGAGFRELIPGTNLPDEILVDYSISPSAENFAPDLVLAPGAPDSVDPAVTGDFDNGFANTRDGPYINGPLDIEMNYFSDPAAPEPMPGVSFYAPHRISLGPGVFGSLPSGVRSGAPWRTLLFRPDRQHFGEFSVPDHLWLDLFRMPTPLPHRHGYPVVQNDWKGDAYSSDGKINLNFQILPFGHVQRSTALRAVLKSEKVIAIPTTAGGEYKSLGGAESYRHFIDADETLQQWERKFAAGDVFRTASEICEQYLVPEGVALGDFVDDDYPQMRAFWADHKLTGDNTKERPYATIYQHLTTQSNSYQVHVLAQTITKSADSPVDVFDPQMDLVGEEYRGSGTLKRSLDPADPGLPNYVVKLLQPSLATFYQFELTGVSPSLAVDFEIIEIDLDQAGHPTVTWLSTPGDIYLVQRSRDLREWIDIATLTSEGDTSDYYDTARPNVQRLYYRILRL